MASIEEINRMTPEERDAELARIEAQNAILVKMLKKQWRVIRWPIFLVVLILLYLCAK